MTPDDLAKSGSEHSQQRALFAWANMAARFGFDAANDDRSYTVQGHAASIAGAPVPALGRLYAIPNGGYRDKVTAGKLKAEGVKKGVPDCFLPLPCRGVRLPPEQQPLHRLTDRTADYAGLYVELKRPKTTKAGVRKAEVVDQRAGSTSDEQDDWIGYLQSVGYAVAVAFNWREAAKQIEQYVRECGG